MRQHRERLDVDEQPECLWALSYKQYLTKEQIKDLIGIFHTPEGVFLINPTLINPATGRAAEGIGSTRALISEVIA